MTFGVKTIGGGGAAVAVKKELIVNILGGNVLSNGLDGIYYGETVTPTKVYDPNVDDEYPNGLGRALLYIDGVPQTSKVLVRHDYSNYLTPFLIGQTFYVLGTDSIEYVENEGAENEVRTAMTIYRVKAWR